MEEDLKTLNCDYLSNCLLYHTKKKLGSTFHYFFCLRGIRFYVVKQSYMKFFWGVEAKCFKSYIVSGVLKHFGVKTFDGLKFAEGK